MTDKATVSHIHLAKPGDLVWVFYSEMSRYVDGKYEGRGVWKLEGVDGETRSSITISRSKFAKEDGTERGTRGWSSTMRAYGEVEREDKQWMDQHKRALVREIEGIRSASTLKAIAELIGWTP